MVEIARRSIIQGLAVLIAAPAIIKVADLMPVNARLMPDNSLLTINRVTRDALLRRLPKYVPGLELARLDVLYGSKSMRLGDVITLGSSNIDPGRQFVITATELDHLHVEYIADRDFYAGAEWDRVGLVPELLKRQAAIDAQHAIPDKLALAAAAVAIAPAVLERPVTRRFWAR